MWALRITSLPKESTDKSRPDWDQYFINIAKVVASRATCLRRRYGAVIVKHNTIMSTGYCGAARGVPNCIDVDKCKREEVDAKPGERYELCKSVHAEQNAIITAPPERMIGATIYIAGIDKDDNFVDTEPCLMCRRFIKNAQISRTVVIKKDGKLYEYRDKKQRGVAKSG
ncbi:MAG: cytidine deaminase [Candidatus Marinimicrobia bacterium]|nr:cytidine deaminase [Candidatus Neomarinimicrobiota bacterium]